MFSFHFFCLRVELLCVQVFSSFSLSYPFRRHFSVRRRITQRETAKLLVWFHLFHATLMIGEKHTTSQFNNRAMETRRESEQLITCKAGVGGYSKQKKREREMRSEIMWFLDHIFSPRKLREPSNIKFHWPFSLLAKLCTFSIVFSSHCCVKTIGSRTAYRSWPTASGKWNIAHIFSHIQLCFHLIPPTPAVVIQKSIV